MSRSSIFSFESFEEFKPQVPKGLVIAALLVVALEVTVRAVPEHWIVPYSVGLGRLSFMEREILPKSPAPKIVVFGTSRSANAFMPTEIDSALGWPEYSTANLSMFGSRTSAWLDLYQRNRAKLSKCKLLIVVTDEWSFSSNVGGDEHFCLHAPLADRWNFVQPTESPALTDPSPGEQEKWDAAKLDFMRLKRNRLLADWAFTMRLKLETFPDAPAKWLHTARRKPNYDKYHMVRSTDREEGKAVPEELSSYHERIHLFYKFFDTQPIYVRHVEELMELTKQDGVKMVLMHLPNRRTFQDQVDKLYPKQYEQHLRVARETAAKHNVPFIWRKYPEEIGLTDTDYVDYCHMAATGSKKATNWLLDLIEKEKWLEK